jgi:tetratricopeptide (TPR) repeat protein
MAQVPILPKPPRVRADPELAPHPDEQSAGKNKSKVQPASVDAGYPPAHLERAKLILNQSYNDADSPQRQFLQNRARWHLHQALKSRGNIAESAAEMLARLELRDDHVKEAIRALAKVPNSSPLQVLRAEALLLDGQIREAHALASQWRNESDRQIMANPLDAAARFQMVRCHIVLGSYQEAIRDIQAAQRLLPKSAENGKNLMALFLRTYHRWLDDLDRDPTAVEERCRVLEKGIAETGGNVTLLARLAQYHPPPKTDVAKVIAALTKCAADRPEDFAAPVALAGIAWRDKKQDEARARLAGVSRVGHHGGVVINNLAWLESNSAKGDADWALLMIEVALEPAPNEPSFRHTKGFALMRKGFDLSRTGNKVVAAEKWKDAAKELLSVMDNLSPKARLSAHAALGEIFGQLGDPIRAADHKAKSQELAASAQKR